MLRGLAEGHGIRFEYADVTGPALELERRHLSGPAAGDELARSLTAVALISADLGREDERVSVQMRVDGPLGGLLVEAAFDGGLRGYTQRKILDGLDGRTDLRPEEVLGAHGSMAVLRSTPQEVLATSHVRASPPGVRDLLARYFNLSQQTPTAVELYLSRDEGLELTRAVGLVAEKMPDGDTERFVEVLERFNDGAVREALSDSSDLDQLSTVFRLDRMIAVTDRRELRFACHCSREKVAEVLRTMPAAERAEMIAQDRSQHVTCHLCGEDYVFSPEEMRAL